MVDMETLQEYTENQSFLRAISSNLEEMVFHIQQASVVDIRKSRSTENLEYLLKEPLGLLFFRSHLGAHNASRYLYFLDDYEHYDYMPPNPLRLSQAKRIFKKYISSTSSLNIGLFPRLVKHIELLLKQNKDCPDLLFKAKLFVLNTLEFCAFSSFIYTKFYENLIAYRLHEQKSVSREDFDFIRVLGIGGFGKVFAVRKSDTGAVYACKTMNKGKVIKKKRQLMLMNERNILTQIRNPFIVNLKYAFQDDEALYLVLDLMTGGELQFHLNRVKHFPEDWTRFYIAGIIIAIEYLHSKNIVYRDLKPENVLLDENGYIRLTDLGLCTYLLPNGKKLKRHCGTRSFMAPEQTFGDEGYDKEVDWWALGVCLYMFLTGHNLFSRRRYEDMLKKEDGMMREGSYKRLVSLTRHLDPKQFYDKCLERKRFNDHLSAESKDLINSLLVIDPAKRLGTAKGASEIKNHPWFANFDWDRMAKRHHPPPFVPSSEHVNAEYYESAFVGIAHATKKTKKTKENKNDQWFNQFDFVSPMVFQDELLETSHNKNQILYNSVFTPVDLRKMKKK